MTANSRIWAVIAAAGSGQRMHSSLPKQYHEHDGKTLLEHACAPFLGHEKIHRLTICLPRGDQVCSRLPLADDPMVRLVEGGETRAQSVLYALLLHLNEVSENDWVIVHDAARPLLSSSRLNHLIEELEGNDIGGLLAVPAYDTVKQCQVNGRTTVAATLPRASIWLAQTPQMFRYSLLLKALQTALENGQEITDEASAIEYLGLRPAIIMGDRSNIKVTTQEDMLFWQTFSQLHSSKNSSSSAT